MVRMPDGMRSEAGHIAKAHRVAAQQIMQGIGRRLAIACVLREAGCVHQENGASEHTEIFPNRESWRRLIIAILIWNGGIAVSQKSA